MSYNKKIAVLVPCYNEELTIKAVIEDFRNVLPEAEVFVYDNNSKDDTVKIAKENGATVCYEYKQGKGNVIRSMFREIEADCYIMVDGDDTYPAEDAKKVAELVLEGKADMAIGDRLSSTYFTENKRPFHNFGNRIVRKLINVIFHSDVKDIMTGCRAFNRMFVKSYPVLSGGFEIETEMTIHALDKNLAIREVGINYKDRVEGSESKLNTYSDGIKVLKTIFSLFKNYRPFLFFGLLSLFIFIISLILFTPILIEYIKTGLVPRFPTLFVSVALLIISIFSFFTGLTLDTIKRYERQFYELTCNLLYKKGE